MIRLTPATHRVLDWLFRWLIRIAAVATLAILIVPAVYTPSPGRAARKRFRSRSEIWNLREALAAYREINGKYPDGTPGQIVGTLRAAKIRSDPLLSVAPNRLNAAGEFLDLWGTPYHLTFDESGKPDIYSFGPNRLDDQGLRSSDDITLDMPGLVRHSKR